MDNTSENTVYVGGLPYKTTEPELEATFNDCGNIVSCKLINDKDTGRSKGYGFIEFENSDAAQKALLKDKTEYEGRTLTVGRAKKQ